MHKWPEAREAFTAILQRFGDSGLVVPARNYLDYMKDKQLG
jgi:hypothetical protein